MVQSRAGGIQLDTLFVDEGFGTLDPESLDFAIRTLLDLQQAGRLVGVVSHVSELRERVDVRLEIRPEPGQPRGSATALSHRPAGRPRGNGHERAGRAHCGVRSGGRAGGLSGAACCA